MVSVESLVCLFERVLCVCAVSVSLCVFVCLRECVCARRAHGLNCGRCCNNIIPSK